MMMFNARSMKQKLKNMIPIKAALADRKKVVRGGFFLVFEKSVVVAAMAAWAEAVQRQG